MKIYTKTGDDGTTGLFGGARVSKADARVDAYGQVDELNSTLGWARVAAEGAIDSLLARVQTELFEMGAELSTVPGKEEKLQLPRIESSSIDALERAIDENEEGLAELKNFVLPGGAELAARLHVARCVCRRAERGVVGLQANEPVRDELSRYLNRLSDLLFTLARRANADAGVDDVPWVPR